MGTAVELFVTILDRFFEFWIVPMFAFFSRGLESVFLKPLDFLQVPVAFQVMVVGLLTALLSLLLRRWLRVEEKEQNFTKAFSAKKDSQKNFRLLPDWKAREVFFRASDNELDEDFNTYLAQRFARHGMVYLLPIFFVLFWLDNVLPKEELIRRIGGPYTIMLPKNSYGVEGLPVPFVFLAAYVLSLLCVASLRKGRKIKSRE